MKQGIEQVVISMNENGLGLEQICKFAKLKKEEVQKILNKKY